MKGLEWQGLGGLKNLEDFTSLGVVQMHFDKWEGFGESKVQGGLKGLIEDLEGSKGLKSAALRLNLNFRNKTGFKLVNMPNMPPDGSDIPLGIQVKK